MEWNEMLVDLKNFKIISAYFEQKNDKKVTSQLFFSMENNFLTSKNEIYILLF